jgi:hypothetical protein
MIKRLLPFLALMALAGCSSTGAPSAPTGEEAQGALQSSLDEDAKASRSAPVSVGNVAVGQCTPSDKHPTTLCAVHFEAQGKSVAAQAMFWKTPNPRHPWRAHLISPTPAR